MATPSTTTIVQDSSGHPAPQFFDSNTGVYAYLYGRFGGAGHIGVAPVFTGNTGTIGNTNVETQFTVSLGSLAVDTGSIFDAKQAQVVIVNSGTSQTITGVSLVLFATVGGATPSSSFTPTGTVSIANNANGTFAIPLTGGLLLPTISLTVTFGTAPIAGEVYVQVTFQSTGAIVPAMPSQAALTDRSGSIAVAGTSQQAFASNATRRYLLIQNLDTTEDLWINFTTTAVESEPSLQIAPGQAFVMESGFVSTEAISVIAATTGHAWAAKEG